VIIATRNRPQLLREAIEAVVRQTYQGAVECIAVFDQCAPDHELAMQDGNRSVRVLTNLRKPGLAGGRNTGILDSNSDYVGFCDDDDLWLPTKLDSQIAAMQASGALTSVTGITVVYADHETDRVPRQADLSLGSLIRTRVTAAHPSSVLMDRRHLLAEVGLVDEEIPGSYGEDFDFLIRAAQSGQVVAVEEPLVRVRWGQSQFSQNWKMIVAAIDYQIAKHPAFVEDDQAIARLYGRKAFALAADGQRKQALATVVDTVRADPRERRAYLAAAVALRVVSARRLMDIAHKRGHGI
jgi:glycosyltransferase involved in cell wall biosynthesis